MANWINKWIKILFHYDFILVFRFESVCRIRLLWEHLNIECKFEWRAEDYKNEKSKKQYFLMINALKLLISMTIVTGKFSCDQV